MSDAKYVTLLGQVAFDPEDRKAGDKDIKQISIQPSGTADNIPLVQCTLWEETKDTPLKRGDFVVVNGKYTTKAGQTQDGNPRTYHNLSVNSIIVLVNGDLEAVPAKKPAASAAF